MAKSIERQVKDAVITRLESLPNVTSVETSGRGKIVAESNLISEKPLVLITFPSPTKIEACGFVRLFFPVVIDARFRFDEDVDQLDLETVRDALDLYEQNVYGAMTEDETWNGIAVQTRMTQQKQKVTSEDLAVPEAMMRLIFQIEIHHLPGAPQTGI